MNASCSALCSVTKLLLGFSRRCSGPQSHPGSKQEQDHDPHTHTHKTPPPTHTHTCTEGLALGAWGCFLLGCTPWPASSASVPTPGSCGVHGLWLPQPQSGLLVAQPSMFFLFCFSQAESCCVWPPGSAGAHTTHPRPVSMSLITFPSPGLLNSL